MKNKLNRQAVDFQPDAMEIAMRPLPLPARLGIAFGATVFFAALLASYFCKVDVIVDPPQAATSPTRPASPCSILPDSTFSTRTIFL